MSTQTTDSNKKTSSTNLNHGVGLYSLAAAVAGVGMLALAEPAAGEVVITKKTIPIFDRFDLDINHDGSTDFIFYSSPSFGFTRITMAGEVVTQSFYAAALTRGAKIGPSAHFSSVALIESGSFNATSCPRCHGHWGGDPKNRYLGVNFLIKGEIHYGWIRLTVLTEGGLFSATITAYAYETVPNKPILAGTAERSTAEVQAPENNPSQRGPSLGMLALGADALPLWRRERTVASN